MDRYRIVYFYENQGPITKEIETIGVVETFDHLIFVDEEVEDRYTFLKKDVVLYYAIEGDFHE